MRLRIPFLKLPACQPGVVRQYERQIRKVIARSQFILGEEVACFEAEFAAFAGAQCAIGVGNGTEALLIALRLSGIRPGLGQEIITTPLTAAFTAHAIVAAGARPVFADIEPHTLLLDPSAVRQQRTAHTAAILPVHLYGQCCDLESLSKLAREFRVPLIQDAAQAHGTQFRGRSLADYSDWVAFSFYPTKNLGALGDGGALLTNRQRLAEAARRFRDGGRRQDHIAHTEGLNSRLDEMQAAILRIHLRHLSRWNRKREQLARLYDRLLGTINPKLIRLLACPPHSRSSHHLYVVRTRRRQALRQFLLEAGIETAVHYPVPLHLQGAFRWLGYQRGDFPHAEQAAREVCSLPLHPFLASEEVREIAGQIAPFGRKK